MNSATLKKAISGSQISWVVHSDDLDANMNQQKSNNTTHLKQCQVHLKYQVSTCQNGDAVGSPAQHESTLEEHPENQLEFTKSGFDSMLPGGKAEVPLLDDDTVAFGEEDNAAKRFVHPYIVFFHLVFRVSAIVVYMLCGWFSDSFIASFVLVVLLLSADFWTVKNISGRLLVGLRWWNYVDDDGKSHWVFESKQNRVNANESRLFWMGLILCPLAWGVFFIFCLFGLKFKWMLLVLIALTLTGANLYGYIKCKFGAKENLKSATTDFFRTQVLQNATSFMFAQPAPPTAGGNTGVI